MLQMKSEGGMIQKFLLLGVGGNRPFILLRLVNDWMKHTYIMEGNMLYSKSTNLNVYIIQNHSHRNIQNSI